MNNQVDQSTTVIREDVTLTVLLNRANYLSRLVDCYFDLTVSDKDSSLAQNIAKNCRELVETLEKAMLLIHCHGDGSNGIEITKMARWRQ